MTLKETIKAIEIASSHQPSVNMVVENDVFRLNSLPNARYGVFGWTQQQHQGSCQSNTITFRFTFFYIDRLREDKANQIEIQSVGIETLDNIIKELNDRGLYVDQAYSFQTFNQRFMDECSGVFCQVAIDVPINSFCTENYSQFNEDFNEDFFIY